MKNFVTEILNLESYTWRHWAVLFFSFILVHFYFVIHAEYSNLAVFQAEAFLKGNLHIAEYFWDVAVYKNQYYVTYPPFPALLLLPSVAIWGNKVNTIFVSLLITCVSIYILYHLLQRYVGNAPIKKWLLAAFFLGSPYWFALLTSDFIYAFAHIVCTALLLLLLYELTGKQRFGLIALYWSMAFMTRQMTIFYGIVILYYIIHNHKEDAFKRLVFIATIFIAITGCYLVLNYMRFDSFLETGYSYLNYSGIIKVRVEQDGLFSHQYFLTNFYHMFLKGHNLLFTGDKLLKPGGIDLFGTSLLAASPFVIFAIKAALPRIEKLALWSTIVLILIGLLLYHNNGWMQVNGQRFALDFFPLLIILVATAHQSIPHWLLRLSVFYAIGLNVLSYIIHAFYS